MKQLVKKILPSFVLNRYYTIRDTFRILENYLYDMSRYIIHSASLNHEKTRLNLHGRLVHAYHNIEKGLSLKKPRIGFGKDKVVYLLDLIKKYTTKYGWDSSAAVAVNVLYSYYNFNKENGLNNEALLNELNEISKGIPPQFNKIKSGGTISVTKDQIISASRINFEEFSKKRYSIRNFGSEPVDIEMIKKAVKIAQKTPSVCNRQTSKVYVFSNEKVREILKYQNGNRGFGETIDKVLLVTGSLEYFNGAAERNQAYIDGGMFAMSLVYALHSLEVGTCCLNLSLEKDVDKNLKNAAGIGQDETVIMMIGIGSLPDQLNVAESYRKEIEEVFIAK